MRFQEFNNIMRSFESGLRNTQVLPDSWFVVRLDGRGFHSLTKRFEKPFDEKFRDLMVSTAKHLMSSDCGVRPLYAHTQSDEISLLFHKDDQTFHRRVFKIVSVLASEASSHFSLQLRSSAAFDARICQLPNSERVVDYFRWRAEDASRNCFNSYAYWALRKAGMSGSQAHKALLGVNLKRKDSLLHGLKVEVPESGWERYGVGIHRVPRTVVSEDRKTLKTKEVTRTSLNIEYRLPSGRDYAWLIEEILEEGVVISAESPPF